MKEGLVFPARRINVYTFLCYTILHYVLLKKMVQIYFDHFLI